MHLYFLKILKFDNRFLLQITNTGQKKSIIITLTQDNFHLTLRSDYKTEPIITLIQQSF